MQAGEALHMCTFHETMSNLHKSVGERMWREFYLSLDFPCIEDILILTVMKLDKTFYIYLELCACEKKTYMEYNGQLSHAVVKLSRFEDD